MKKTSSARFPEPMAGVMRSEHPRAVGVNGLVEASNFVKHDGKVIIRDGLTYQYAPDDSDGSSIISMGSFDYQNEGDEYKDGLLVVTDSSLFAVESDLQDSHEATPADVDWTLGGMFGPSTTEGQLRVYSNDVLVNFDAFDWSKFNGSADAVFIRIGYNPSAGGVSSMTVRLFEVTTSATANVGATFASSEAYYLTSSYLTEGGESSIIGRPEAILNGSDADTGIRVTFNKEMGDYNTNWRVAGGINTSNAAENCVWYGAIFKSGASDWGLPGQSTVVDLDSSQRPVMRAWDYNQITNVIVAAEDRFMLAVDMDLTAGVPDPSVTLCGSAGECPRASCIGITGQRIIAGDVSYFDAGITLEDNSIPVQIDADDTDQEFHQIHGNEGFAYWPDAIVFSGTVLTGGHLFWYPADILRLADTPGRVVAIQEIGIQQAVVYKTDAIYTLTAQSGIAPFVPTIKATGIKGPVSARAIVTLDTTTHLYLGRDGGIYMFNGGQPQDIGDQFRSWISREIDSDNAELSFMVYDSRNKHVHVYYPVKGLPDTIRKGLVIDVSSQPFTGWPVLYAEKSMGTVPGMGDPELVDHSILCSTLHFTDGQNVALGDLTVPTNEALGTLTEKREELLFGIEFDPGVTPRTSTPPGNIMALGRYGSDNGQPIEATMTSGIIDFGDPDSNKVLLELEILSDPHSEVDTTNTVFWGINASDAEMTVTIFGGNSVRKLKQLWQGTADLTSTPIVVRPRVRARYFSYRIDFTSALTTSAVKEHEFWGL